MHEAQHAAGGGGIVYRRAEDDAVRLLHQGQNLSHRAAKDAFAGFGTAATAHATTHRRAADVENRRFDAGLLQHASHFVQSGIGAAVFVRTAIDQ